jgi:hypothetical protein
VAGRTVLIIQCNFKLCFVSGGNGYVDSYGMPCYRFDFLGIPVDPTLTSLHSSVTKRRFQLRVEPPAVRFNVDRPVLQP